MIEAWSASEAQHGGVHHREWDKHGVDLTLEVLSHGSTLHFLVNLVLFLSVMVGYVDDFVLVEFLHVLVFGRVGQGTLGLVSVGETDEATVGVAGELGVNGFNFLDRAGCNFPVFGEGLIELLLGDLLLDVFREEVCLVDDVREGFTEASHADFPLLKVIDV